MWPYSCLRDQTVIIYLYYNSLQVTYIALGAVYMHIGETSCFKEFSISRKQADERKYYYPILQIRN